ncbi:MAG: hypothetical protein RL758_747 [Pseudomonadota bacterium]|jgi:hypothetical protein
MKRLFAVLVPLLLSGCLLESVGRIDRSIKPYGAHWVKEGMTREKRITDWLQCGGTAELGDGYERKSNMTNKDFFDGLNLHRQNIRICMAEKNYQWIEQCDHSCLYP